MLKEQVQEKVTRLLALVIAPDVDPESYEFVLNKLTRMAIIGTAPASCAPKGCKKRSKRKSDGVEHPAVADNYDGPQRSDDFASLKEAFIAP